MGAMGLNEIWEAARTANAGDRRDFLVPDLALFDQLEIKSQHGKVPAARAPGRMVGHHFFFSQAFAIVSRDGGHGCQISSAWRNFGGCAHSNVKIGQSLRIPEATVVLARSR